MKITFQNLEVTPLKNTILGPLTLELDSFQCLGLIGYSGSGKTTLLRVLSGLMLPSVGEAKIILPKGDVLLTPKTQKSEILSYRKRLGVVFQAFNLFPHLSALENITLPLIKVHHFSKNEAKERAYHYLAKFRLEGYGDRLPSKLSGGQQQRIAIVRSAALEPEVLFLDEPTSALDPESTLDVLRMIDEIKDSGNRIVMVTHHMGFAKKVPDKLLLLENARIIAQINPKKTEEYPKAFSDFFNQESAFS